MHQDYGVCIQICHGQVLSGIIFVYPAFRMLSGPHVCGDTLQIDPAVNHILSGSWRKDNALEVTTSATNKQGWVVTDYM